MIFPRFDVLVRQPDLILALTRAQLLALLIPAPIYCANTSIKRRGANIDRAESAEPAFFQANAKGQLLAF
jgi:hypothetical protein